MQSKEITKAEANILGKNLSYSNQKNDANNTQTILRQILSKKTMRNFMKSN